MLPRCDENAAAQCGRLTGDDAEAEVGQPAGDLGCRIEPSLRDGREEHRILRGPQRPRLIVIEQHVMDDDASAGRECGSALCEQSPAFGLVPIVKHVREEVEIVARGPRLREHVDTGHFDPGVESGGGDPPPGDGIDGWGFQHRRREIGESLGQGDGVDARSAADVEQPPRRVAIHGRGQRRREHPTTAVHGRRECFRDEHGA